MTGVLDFLSPSKASDAVARSSMERRFRDAGATFETRDGWLVPVSVPGESEHLAVVGMADLSHLTKLEVRPAPSATTDDGVVTYAISPRRGLLLFEAARAAAVRQGLDAATFVLDVTAQHGILALAGPEAPTLLRRLTHLHRLPSGGEVAHITAHVLVPRSVGPDVSGPYWIVFPQEYGHYLYEVAVDCAAALGGGPVGIDALGDTA